MRGKQVFAAAIISAVGLLATPAWAGCASSNYVATCSDTTKIEAYKGDVFQKTYSNNNFISGIGDVLQSSGDAFNTDKLIATITSSRHYTTLELKFYTSFDGSALGASYADIFLANGLGPTSGTPNGSNGTAANSFNYAIALGKEQSSAGFYEVTSSNTETSKEVWHNKSGTYGGEFQGSDGKWYDSPVEVDAGTAKYAGSTPTPVTGPTTPLTSVAFKSTTGGSNFAPYGKSDKTDPGSPYLIDVKLTLSNVDFNALFNNGLSVFWGTADCSNDAILAYIPLSVERVPEPVTLSLFSAGVAGAAVMRRRRKSKAA